METQRASPTIYGTRNGCRTPESKCTPSKEVTQIARQLGLDIVHHAVNNNNNKFSGLCGSGSFQPVARTLRRTVDEIYRRHQIPFKSMINKVDITADTVTQVFEAVAEEMFRDGQYNWGRVVSVYAFGARLAKHAADQRLVTDVDFIGQFIGNYVADKLGWWIETNGGWVGFQEYFPESPAAKLEDNLWKGLLCTAGVGLAALAAVVAVR